MGGVVGTTTASVDETLMTTTRASDSASRKARMSAARRSTASAWLSWPSGSRCAPRLSVRSSSSCTRAEGRVRDDARVSELGRTLEERHVDDVVTADDEVVEGDEAGCREVGLLGDEAVGALAARGDEGEAGGHGGGHGATGSDQPETRSFVAHVSFSSSGAEGWGADVVEVLGGAGAVRWWGWRAGAVRWWCGPVPRRRGDGTSPPGTDPVSARRR